ncbi:DNA breaking-rejoining enzyme [Neolentinus lepideus HHB14362 ss-1]|uniref:DNA breaking-rejoining enzyme n=1 Tax=Neolentinus lepideus HHB14362 ss-1 TaxID=1314782 RepID=A0A165NVT2_9AGAM|nr:DNA breaking-rejoining enzyme [Neolentinus lepideus HHB14362 ss-1]
MSAVRAWHKQNGAHWEGDKDYISLVKTSAHKFTPSSSKHVKCFPVTIEHLIALDRYLDLQSGHDCAVSAIAQIAFWSCCHLGELTIPTHNGFDPHRHVAHSSPVRFADHWDGLRSAHLHIPFGKVERESGADISVTGWSELCPVCALQTHLADNAVVPPDAPMFSYVMAGGWVPLTKAVFLQCCKEIWDPVRLSRVSGHSFCIGGATELLLAGVPPEVVAVQGQWKSLAFLLYWRKLEDLLPLMISRSYDKSCVEKLCEEFEAYRIHNNLPAVILSAMLL